MDIDQFISTTNGTHVDEDGYYGAQCWDLVARYARVVVGCPSFPTGSGGAEGLYRLFEDPIPQYFDRIANDTTDPNQQPAKGDVIVWQASFSPPYGHTALCISANSSGVTVLEQNGNNPGGDAYIITRSYSGIAGWLRPKQGATNIMQTLTPDQASAIYAEYGYDVPASSEACQNRQELELRTGIAGMTKGDLTSDKATIDGLNTELNAERLGNSETITDLNTKLSTLQGSYDELVKTDSLKDQRIADLQAQVPGSTEVEQPVVSPDTPQAPVTPPVSNPTPSPSTPVKSQQSFASGFVKGLLGVFTSVWNIVKERK